MSEFIEVKRYIEEVLIIKNEQYRRCRYIELIEHWLIGLSSVEKQYLYEQERKQWRKDHNIPDRLNVKGANVIPARYS